MRRLCLPLLFLSTPALAETDVRQAVIDVATASGCVITDAMASTANYLRQKGWQPGLGYQEGEPNFAVIKEWNAAKVYQQAIALMGARIDG